MVYARSAFSCHLRFLQCFWQQRCLVHLSRQPCWPALPLHLVLCYRIVVSSHFIVLSLLFSLPFFVILSKPRII
jgi:hypothetical protein